MTPDLQSQSTATAFRMKGGLYTLTTLELHVATMPLIKKQLQLMTQKAPNFFQQTPVVIALEKLQTQPYMLNISSLKHLLYDFGMILVAVRGGSESARKEAKLHGIAWLPAAKSRSETDDSSENNTAANVVKITKSRGLPDQENISEVETKLEKSVPDIIAQIVERPVRSGQQIYSPGDLVVLGSVSTGAELVAGGHIHVYGPLRGRALAGVNGHQAARIFCGQFEAELISVCGQYKLPANSDRSYWGKSVLVSLKDQCLHMAAL
ncbi:MAG: septum site-determining protein MinC [Endozoicomonas sp. (ex Botrylloides leachii)]|nr:septum site-determining protein MinC [Endozoicomonas sp. (ex Botrylloides leachii)]